MCCLCLPTKKQCTHNKHYCNLKYCQCSSSICLSSSSSSSRRNIPVFHWKITGCSENFLIVHTLCLPCALHCTFVLFSSGDILKKRCTIKWNDKYTRFSWNIAHLLAYWYLACYRVYIMLYIYTEHDPMMMLVLFLKKATLHSATATHFWAHFAQQTMHAIMPCSNKYTGIKERREDSDSGECTEKKPVLLSERF